MMHVVFKTVFLWCFLLADASEYTAYPKIPMTVGALAGNVLCIVLSKTAIWILRHLL